MCLFKKSTLLRIIACLECNWERGSLEKGENRNLIYYSDSQISCAVYMITCLSSIKSFFYNTHTHTQNESHFISSLIFHGRNLNPYTPCRTVTDFIYNNDLQQLRLSFRKTALWFHHHQLCMPKLLEVGQLRTGTGYNLYLMQMEALCYWILQ